MSNELIEGMADYIAQGVEGLSYEDLADGHADLKTKHRLGHLTDINQLTKSEARAIAKCCKRLVLEDLSDNITPEMVLAAYGVMDNRHTGMSPMKAALTAALKAAMEG